MNTTADSTLDNTSRPFGFWLKAIDRLMAQDFATVFAAEGATRRDWRLLNVVDGSVPARRPLNPHKLHDLIDRGWVEADGDGWALTDEGRAAKERLGAAVDGIRAKVADAVSDEEMATTLAALEKIARAFGWDEETPLPRKQRPGFGFGPRGGFARRHGHGNEHGRGFGHGFGHGDFDPRHGFDPRHSFGPEEGFGPRHGFDRHDGAEEGGYRGRGHHDGQGHRDHGHAHRDHGRGHGHGHGHRAQRMAERAFERGFDAGFRHGHAA
ncbi:MarR family winged helix-turn-helix transcriptional regulator [Microbacterium sp. NPDC057658]|uniref:MarR family winged helix-turn-helix transcriptional regulator n=1 Tax=unclassified Microbacterium TaxID=2609290 RepID=UPI00366F1783